VAMGSSGRWMCLPNEIGKRQTHRIQATRRRSIFLSYRFAMPLCPSTPPCVLKARSINT
jgi:hypothetical protein